MLDNPLYLGNRHERVRGKKYHEFVDKFVETAERLFPNLYLHWEDFGRPMQQPFSNATRIKLQHLSDDIQGTGIVSLAAILGAHEHFQNRNLLTNV